MITGKWFIKGTLTNRGKTMYVRKDLFGYTSKVEKAAQFNTKREAKDKINMDDKSYGDEMLIKICCS
jgi:hypothetical protein